MHPQSTDRRTLGLHSCRALSSQREITMHAQLSKDNKLSAFFSFEATYGHSVKFPTSFYLEATGPCFRIGMITMAPPSSNSAQVEGSGIVTTKLSSDQP